MGTMIAPAKLPYYFQNKSFIHSFSLWAQQVPVPSDRDLSLARCNPHPVFRSVTHGQLQLQRSLGPGVRTGTRYV